MKVCLKFKDIDWKIARRAVREMQDELVRAFRLGNKELVTKIQFKIVRSFGARALAVKRVSSNTGGKTPGIDGVIWSKDLDLEVAINELLYLSEYKAKLVRRMYIPKDNIKLRPLGIPRMFDRAVQALYFGYTIDSGGKNRYTKLWLSST